MKKLLVGYLAFCTSHIQARCLSKMDHKNNSSQVKSCLSYSDTDKENKPGTSQSAMGGSSTKRTHSQCSSTDSSESRPEPGVEAQPRNTFVDVKLKREPECHMQLDKLSSSAKHTVLIDTSKLPAGKIVPYMKSLSPVWDNVNVKLPHHYPTHKGKESRWEVTVKALRALTRGSASVGDVEEAIKSYNQAHSKEWQFEALYAYVKRVPHLDTDFPCVISKMAKLALKLPDLIQHPIPLLRQHSNKAITMSQEQISCLLAHAFFCTFPHRNAVGDGSEYSRFPTINFSSLFADSSERKFQKLRGLFHYFNTVTEEATKPHGLVTFERISLDPKHCPDWNTRLENLTTLQVHSTGFIENEGEGMLQVDFAAKFIGGGVLGKGLVQEEISFIQCPELIVARLFTEQLDDNECLKITGFQMYNKTIGYSDDFEWHSPHIDRTGRDEWKRRYRQIVAIDALNFNDPQQQFTEKNIRRELFKAYIGFRSDPNVPIEYTPAIATGNWGCGAFKGDPMLKALIQMMAAAVAQRDLAYFTFGNEKQADKLKRMHALLKDHKMTVGKLYHLLQDYSKHCSHNRNGAKNLFDFIRDKLAVRTSQL